MEINTKVKYRITRKVDGVFIFMLLDKNMMVALFKMIFMVMEDIIF